MLGAWEGPGSPLRSVAFLAGIWARQGQVRTAGWGPGVSPQPVTFLGPVAVIQRMPGARRAQVVSSGS